jgi:hypothetical protein
MVAADLSTSSNGALSWRGPAMIPANVSTSSNGALS